MAEIPYGGAGQTRAGQQNFSTLTHYAGAVVSLGLVVGIGVWGYGVLVRDAGGVPVVRAVSSEPMRVAPETPGGVTAAHQGLSVNEVMAQGGAEKPADRLVLAPAPVNLLDEDQPLSGVVAPQKTPRTAPVMALQPEDTEAAEPLTPQLASIQALAEQLSDGVQPLAAPVADPVAAPAPEEQVAALAPEVSVEAEGSAAAAEEAQPEPPVVQAALVRSLRPKLRPQAVVAGVTPEAVTEAVVAAVTQDVPVGTRLVQLGAFDSAEVAEREWTRLSGRFEEYFEGKAPVVQRAESGGRTFYRLRAMGFADLSDSRRFCAALLAERADCIPVVSK